MMKKQGKMWVRLTIAAFVLTMSVVLQQSPADADTAPIDGPEDVIEAVKASPSVKAEIFRARKLINAKQATPEEIKVIELGGVCGVAGCSASYLAIITVHRSGVNPQSSSVLARVGRSPRGVLGRVSVVELKEKGREDLKLEIQRSYSSP